MKRTFFLVLGLLFFASVASALPPRQHLAKGTVAAIGPDAIVLTVETTAAKDAPTSFAIKPGRTRLREDGRKVMLERPKVGQPVRVYYRKEMGVWVATEVSWKPGP